MSKGGFKFFNWQTAQSRVYFVPLYEKQKNSRQTDTKGRDCALAMIPLNLNNASYKSGTKLTNVMNNAMLDKYDPVTGDYKGSVDLKKLGKYNYFKFVIYDIDAKGGYDTPAIYYFRL